MKHDWNKSIVIYAGIYPNSGIGNVLRMKCLADFLSARITGLKIDFFAVHQGLTQALFSKKSSVNFITYGDRSKTYDLAFYDSVKEETEILEWLYDISGKIFAFDFFNYSNTHIHTIINLINHNKSQVSEFKGRLLEGVKYAILREEFYGVKARTFPSNTIESVLITFGGEDPNNNTCKVLEQIEVAGLKITILMGKMNKNKKKIEKQYGSRYRIEKQVDNIVDYYKSHDAVICGGGTTLLEILSMGIPVCPVGQHDKEIQFINKMKNDIKLLTIEDIVKSRTLKNLETLSKAYKEYVDGRGKYRIMELFNQSDSRNG